MSVPPRPGSAATEPPPGAVIVERARQACATYRVDSEGTDPLAVRVPPEAVDELWQNVVGTASARVEQLVPYEPRTWPRESFWGWVSRRLAEQQCSVERFYLFASSAANRRRVDRQVADDNEHRVRSRAVPVAGWGTSAPQIPMNPMWLIDNEVVIRQESGFGGAGPWLVTRGTAEVRRARTLLAAAREHATAPVPRIGPDLAGELFESAGLLQQVAPLSCCASPYIDAEECDWYHGYWQYLRLFDMVSSPTWHEGFYADQLRREIVRRNARRILISGSADYTTLAFVLHAARDRLDDVEIHVMDLCDTPLMACRWYAQRVGTKVSTHLADVTRASEADTVENGMSGAFDLIVADAFLTRFAPEKAERVVASWSALLRPGGTVVTTVRLHPSNEYADESTLDLEFGSGRRVTDPVDDFELRLRERAGLVQDKLPIDLESLSKAGRRYAKRMISHDLGDAEEIARIFKVHDFELERNTAARVDGELVGTEYLRITARRSDARSEEATSD
jgi:SAM-dependent methyltransferase